MNKRKKIILCLVTAAAVLAIGVTFAFLSVTTGTAANIFKSDRYLNIKLREPSWDGYDFSSTSDPDGSSAISGRENDNNLGVVASKTYVPGQTIPKDPQVKNTGTGENAVDAYVAIKVTYAIGGTAKSYADFCYKKTDAGNNGGVTTSLDFDTSNWVLIEDRGTNGQIYLYKTTGADNSSVGESLRVGSTTEPLFTKVPISPDVTTVLTTVNGVEMQKPPTFDIKVQAYAVQVANVDAAKAGSQLLKLIPND